MAVTSSLTPTGSSSRRGWKPLVRVSVCALLALVVYQVEQASAQSHIVTGRVVSADLAPLIGVNVVVQGTTIGTLTNASGGYQLTAPSPTATLQFSAIGYRQVVEPIAGRSLINVTLQETAIALEEIVAVGYGTQTRATVSGAVSSVSARDIEGTSATNTADALVGRIRGINTRMTTSGAGRDGTSGTPVDGRPGGAAVIQIRNMGDPLYLIDGIPATSRDFAMLNPNDIEDLSVLKDASAAVYGFQAANGAILVTTKKGSTTQAPLVRFDGYYGWQNLTRYHYDSTMTTAYEYFWSRVDSDQNRNLATRAVTPEELEKWRVGGPGYVSTDHYPLVVNNPNAPQFTLNASISGGAPNAQYFLSVGGLKSEYVMRDNAFSRVNLRLNLSSELTNRFRIGTEVSARQEFQDNVAVQGSSDIVRSLLLGVHSSWPFENPWIDEERTKIAYDVRRIDRTVAMYTQDISGFMRDYNRHLNTNLWAEYVLPFGTRLRGTVSANYSNRVFDKQQFDFTAWTCTNKSDTSTCREILTPAPRLREQVKSDALSKFASIQANHSARFGQNSLAGSLAVEVTGSENWRTQLNAVPPHNLTHIIRISDVTNMSNDWGISRRASFAGTLRYNYAERYLVDLLGRYDGSYLYAPGKRWGFFPGVTTAWRVTQEPFMQNRFSFLNELKLRASIGSTGREQGVNAWGYLEGGTYGSGQAVLDGARVAGLDPRGLPVTNITWVTSTIKNGGVDLIMFDNRLSAEVDIFERRLSGIPASRSEVVLPQEVGYTIPNENLETSATRGFEFSVAYRNRLAGVNYMISPNFTVARTMWLERYRERYENSYDYYRSATERRWNSTNWGYFVEGQFQSVEHIENYPVDIDGQGNRTMLPGDFIVRDVNGDGRINAMDERPMAYPDGGTPIYSAGLLTNFTYRGVTLNLNWNGAAGYAHNRGAETKSMFQGDHNGQRWVMDRWRREDPYNPQSAWIPGRYMPHRQGINHISVSRNLDFWRTSVKYWRMRTAELGYTVPNALSSNFGLTGVRVYTSATNPWMIDNTSHYRIDPEIAQGTALNYPNSRVVTVGFNASLGGARIPAPVVPVPPAD